MYFVSVDVLRALACVMIFLYHCNTFLPGEWKFITVFGEDIGNNLFFMISGFTLYRSIVATSFKGFLPWYGKRLYRILPLLALAYAASFVSGFYSFSDRAQLFTVFVYPTLYWFVTAILAFYPILFLTGKLIRGWGSFIFALIILAAALIRCGTLECHYITGFFAMYTGFCLARHYEAKERGSHGITYWIGAAAMTIAYITARRFFPGKVSLAVAMVLCASLVMAFSETENGFKNFFEKRKGLHAFFRHLGNMAMVLYLVQCFNGGLIGFTIGQRVAFPLSFPVNLVLIWSLTCFFYALDQVLFRRKKKR